MEETQKERPIEWDENKNQINIRKHGISFELAKFVFADEHRVEWYDEAHSIDEERYKVLGKVEKNNLSNLHRT